MNMNNENLKLIRVKKYNNITKKEAEKMLKIVFAKESFVFNKESMNSFYYALFDNNSNLTIDNEYINRVIVYPNKNSYSHVELTIEIKHRKFIVIIPHDVEIVVCSHYKKNKICIDSSNVKEKTELNFLSIISK